MNQKRDTSPSDKLYQTLIALNIDAAIRSVEMC